MFLMASAHTFGGMTIINMFTSIILGKYLGTKDTILYNFIANIADLAGTLVLTFGMSNMGRFIN